MKTYITKIYLLLFIAITSNLMSLADTRSRLWLSDPKNNSKSFHSAQIECNAITSPILTIAKKELKNYPTILSHIKLVLDTKEELGEGYHLVVNETENGHIKRYDAVLTAKNDIGLLYASYELIRLQETNKLQTNFERKGKQKQVEVHNIIDEIEKPAFKYRILNHWDNLDGSIERGYAGKSIFWNSDRTGLVYYARANASIGINGTVLNNVNASPKVLTHCYLDSVQRIADILRPYGIKVYLSVNFGTPKALGETSTADPLDKSVIEWWQKKAKEIYQLIPDFGGFLVKASSEGQPGPNDYGRSHADGANMLADALAPYNGIVMWRSFVYGAGHKGEDRVMQAVSEFKPLDGLFHKNVILQSKNGPLDFQPREPYAPIFDNIKKTSQMAELQITQEYTGQSKHLVYLAPMWKEFFSYINPSDLQGIAGVANIGDDANWCGHPFSEANWYAFGRLAWNPNLSSKDIAWEWIQQSLPKICVDKRILDMMESSRETCVNYMMPLGLHHIFAFDHHYGPEPAGYKKEYPIEWCPVYYHKADSIGIGFDRSSTGSNAVSQYREPYRSIYNDVSTCPEAYLLWFHHVSWNYQMKNGQTLWNNLKAKYNEGVDSVESYIKLWKSIDRTSLNADDQTKMRQVDQLLQIQLENARLWRDTCIDYFRKFAHQK